VFSDAFIRRPILATVCSLVIILAGAICIPTLPIARYPQLAPPSVSVTAFYTGANAQAVESAVTTPLEQVINGVEGMTYMQSSSTNSGVSTINVYFDIGRDPDHLQGIFELAHEWMVEAGKDSTWVSMDHPDHGYPYLYRAADGSFNPDATQRKAFETFMAYFDEHLKNA